MTRVNAESGKVRTWILAWIGAAVLGLGALAGIGCLVSANACPFRSSKPITSTDGQFLFLALCTSCHGRNGEGGTGPSLRSGAVTTYDIDTLAEKIRRGKPLNGMPAFGKPAVGRTPLTSEQIRAIAEYVRSLSTSPSPSGSPS